MLLQGILESVATALDREELAKRQIIVELIRDKEVHEGTTRHG